MVAVLEEAGIGVDERVVVADDRAALVAELTRLAASVDLVVTTGGTGLAPTDRTPEATADIADLLVPGLAEEMRRAGRETTPMASLSRALVAVRGRCLIVNLPGSPAGAEESLRALLPVLPHALDQVVGGGDHGPR